VAIALIFICAATARSDTPLGKPAAKTDALKLSSPAKPPERAWVKRTSLPVALRFHSNVPSLCAGAPNSISKKDK
jgi:hypothetical protein